MAFPDSLFARFRDGVPQWLYVLEEVVELDLGLSRENGRIQMQICLTHCLLQLMEQEHPRPSITKGHIVPDRAEVIQEPEWYFPPRVPSP